MAAAGGASEREMAVDGIGQPALLTNHNTALQTRGGCGGRVSFVSSARRAALRVSLSFVSIRSGVLSVPATDFLCAGDVW